MNCDQAIAELGLGGVYRIGLLFHEETKNFHSVIMDAGGTMFTICVRKDSYLSKTMIEVIKGAIAEQKDIWMGLSYEVVCAIRETLPQPIAEEIRSICPLAQENIKIHKKYAVIQIDKSTFVHFNATQACMFNMDKDVEYPIGYGRVKICSAHGENKVLVDNNGNVSIFA